MTDRAALELLLVLAGAGAVMVAGLWVLGRYRLLEELRRFAERLAEGDETVKPPEPRGPALAGLIRALASLGRQIAEVRASEKGSIERARRLAEAVLEAMPDPVLVIDGEARISRSNSAARRLFGLALSPGTPAAELGSPVLQLAAEEASVGFPVASNQVPRVELTVEGVKRQLRVRALPLGGEGTSGAVLVLQDVSESEAEVSLRRAAQSALIELRPLVDGLGVALLQRQAGEESSAAIDLTEWRAIDRLLRDLETAGADRATAAVDLRRLAEEAVAAVSLEAQRLGVKLAFRSEAPAPQPATDEIAAQRLLLRTLRRAVQLRTPGATVAVSVRARPRPALSILPGLPRGAALSAIDAALLERARVALLDEETPEGNATVLHFSEQGP